MTKKSYFPLQILNSQTIKFLFIFQIRAQLREAPKNALRGRLGERNR